MSHLNRLTEAAALLRQSADLNPQEASIYYQLGRTLQALGRQQEAQAVMRKVRELREQANQREVDWSTHAVAGVR
jgi:tetratricopeptide (TPR) repeat protein